jgi:hypothetical protein
MVPELGPRVPLLRYRQPRLGISLLASFVGAWTWRHTAKGRDPSNLF